MKAVSKIVFLNESGEKFFGEGPCRLLHAVEETGSLNAAAMSMDMAYTKALKMLKNAEAALGFRLTFRAAGGKNGGGSRLTEEGRAFLEKYEQYRAACVQANAALFRQHFPQTACVIMASGEGKRFGGNKLMADFCGAPMIGRVLDATGNVFSKQIVVTRHEDVAAYCRMRNVQVILHDRPLRSDTVRLGVEAAGDTECCMFCPGDQPLLGRDTVLALLQAWENDREFIWRTACEGVPGSPVIFPNWAFEELKQLPEGKGGGYLLAQHEEKVRCMNVADQYELMDADTPDELEQLRKICMEKGLC